MRFCTQPSLRILLAVGAALFVRASDGIAKEFTSLHPEEAYPDSVAPLTQPGPYKDFYEEVQKKLHQHGFDAGPVNGDFGSKTQAAVAQFQLSRTLPASGQLDNRTLEELGVEQQK
jgi:peptidoglycan hydrolase-like protein with peptidoglycan-binding domain